MYRSSSKYIKTRVTLGKSFQAVYLHVVNLSQCSNNPYTPISNLQQKQ